MMNVWSTDAVDGASMFISINMYGEKNPENTIPIIAILNKLEWLNCS
jgi:hypothetical protein